MPALRGEFCCVRVTMTHESFGTSAIKAACKAQNLFHLISIRTEQIMRRHLSDDLYRNASRIISTMILRLQPVQNLRQPKPA